MLFRSRNEKTYRATKLSFSLSKFRLLWQSANVVGVNVANWKLGIGIGNNGNISFGALARNHENRRAAGRLAATSMKARRLTA